MQSLSEFIVDVSGLEFRIDHKNILHAVDFKVRKGELFFITGASGCGKSAGLLSMAERQRLGDAAANGRFSHGADLRAVGSASYPPRSAHYCPDQHRPGELQPCGSGGEWLFQRA